MCRIPGYLYYRPHHLPYQQQQKIFPLPLKAVSVDAKVADFCASVTVRQTFKNEEDTPIEAIYQFPLEEKATVSDFTAIIDGKKIKGTIQEKEEAKNTYDDAIASGHGAYLMEEDKDTPNVFTVNVGNLPPGKEVEIAITYVTELEFEEGQLRFRLPSHNDNPAYTTSSSAAPHLKLRIDFNMTSNIRSLASPSHPISFEFGEEPTQATVTLSDTPQAQAAKDLVVLTKLAKPHEPCGRVEVDEKGAKTVMVSLYPKLDAADDEDIYTEMIFIVDRSGSMSGSRINQVKDTLQIFLRSLGEGTMFNIIGFGSNTQHLFSDGSVEYNDKNLKRATEHVAQMSADLGGTNILRPLQEVLRSSTKEGYPRQLFILTDGEVSNTQACIDFVRQHAQTTRVFTFGVGNDASQDLVKGLAKAGEGFYEFVRPGEAMEDKVMRQLHRAMQPALTDITVEWKGAARVQPAPFRLAPLFCGGRLVLYGLLDKAAAAAAGEVEVVVRAKTVLRPFEAVVKVDTAKTESGSLFRKLAARTLLKDLEEGRSYMHDDNRAVKPGAGDVQAEAVRISLESGVLSKYTAFVAVEERDEATEGTMLVRKITFEKAASAQPVRTPYGQTWGVPPTLMHCGVVPPPSKSFSTSFAGSSPRSFSMRSSVSTGTALPPPPPPGMGGPPPPPSPMMSGGAPPPPCGPPGMAFQQQQQQSLYACVPAPSPMMAMAPCAPAASRNSLFAPSMPTSSMSAPSMSAPPMSAPAPARGGAPPTSFMEAKAKAGRAESFSRSRKSSASEEREEPTLKSTTSAPPSKMREIIMKQNASGSWEWSHAADLVGLSADKLRAGIPAAKLQSAVDKEVEALWATAVVAAFLSKHFPDQKINWDLVVKKAIKFIARQKKKVQLKDSAEELDWFQLALAFLA